MAIDVDYLSLTSLIIAVFAASISLLRFKKESGIQREANIVTTYYDIVKIIDSDRAVESRGLLRENSELNKIKNVDPDQDGTKVPELDNLTLEAARYVATTYDRLGFILRHDPKLEHDILEWNGDVIADMWMMTRLLIKKKWRIRNPNYAKEFERLAEKAILELQPVKEET